VSSGFSACYDPRPLVPRERRLWLAFIAAAVGLRAVAFFRYRFDSDEQQHAHVAWGWTEGLVQYRDLFDNHTPLFHMLMAPFVALFGERSDILLWLRLPMLFVFGGILWGTYLLARKLYDERVARWAVVLLALFPPFFLKSLEFRPDNLWTLLWLAALFAIMNGKRPFAIGLLLGAAFGVSTKTAPLLISMAISAAIVRIFLKRRISARWIEGLAGFAIVPVLLALYFLAVGGFDELVYCNLTFNANLARTRTNLWVGRALFPFLVGAVLWLAWRYRNVESAWRYYLVVLMGVYAVTLAGFWPLISPRDFLPLMPVAAIFTAAIATRMQKPLVALAAIAVVCVLALWKYADRFENRTAWHTTMLDQALRLTRPGETIIDLKGETIFRRRPFYLAFEHVTRALIAHRLLADTVAQDVIRTRTYVAQADGPMWPPAARAFLNEHFVNLGRLRAAGQQLRPDGTFTIAIPGEYVIVGPEGELRGPRQLGAGAHRFEGAKDAYVLWAPAFRRGHSPYRLRDLRF
jgi:hypothetical protein